MIIWTGSNFCCLSFFITIKNALVELFLFILYNWDTFKTVILEVPLTLKGDEKNEHLGFCTACCYCIFIGYLF